jgi:uncharacterized pyridoxal phosphate-dependent enzyme
LGIYEKLGVHTIINAVDTYTILGGSIIRQEVIDAMEEASRFFVNMTELHNQVGERLAELTHNEAAFVTCGAAAAMAIATAACITGLDPAKIDKLPDLSGLNNEVIVHRCQRNGYDHAIRQIGVKLVEVGNVDVTHGWQLESAITEKTACIFYFAASTFQKGALRLEEVIAIGQRHRIPVIVDAAAQLPPVDNLWKFTQMGADAAIFSGGKSLRGPQASGLIVGKKSLIEACKLNSNPNHSLGRSMKTGKEEIIGLLTAVEHYIDMDHGAVVQRMEDDVAEVRRQLNIQGIRVDRLFPGPTGQHYPRAAVYVNVINRSAVELQRSLAEGSPGIMVGITPEEDGIIVNPANLQEHELDIVIGRIKGLLLANN